MEKGKGESGLGRTGRIFTAVSVAGVLALSGACTKRIYVPVERVVERTVADSASRVVERNESVVVRDSAVTAVRGDTVRTEIWRWRERVHTERDTVWRERVDTVRISVDSSKAVEAAVASAEKAAKETSRQGWRRLLWGAVLLVSVVSVLWLMRRRRGV